MKQTARGVPVGRSGRFWDPELLGCSLSGRPLHILGNVAVAADELPTAYGAPLRITSHMVVMARLGAAVVAAGVVIRHAVLTVLDAAVVTAAAFHMGPGAAVYFQHSLAAGPAGCAAGGNHGL